MVLDLKKRYRSSDPFIPGKPVPLDDPINIITWDNVADWTDININQYISVPNVKFVYLFAELYFKAPGNGHPIMSGFFRRKGSTATSGLPRIINEFFYTEVWNMGLRACTSVTVGVNEAGLFEVKLQVDSGAPSNINFVVDLIGYSL
jgi:hypothetical protein